MKRVHVPVFIPRAKLNYLSFALKYRRRLKHIDEQGKEFIYDLFMDCTTNYFDLQNAIDYYHECQAILEYSVD